MVPVSSAVIYSVLQKHHDVTSLLQVDGCCDLNESLTGGRFLMFKDFKITIQSAGVGFDSSGHGGSIERCV